MKKRISIGTNVALTAIFFMGILTAAIALIGYKLYHDSVMESYITYTDTVLEYAYRAAEQYAFGDMIADREMPEDYETLRSELNLVKDSSKIEYLYAIYFDDINDIHSLHYAINAKSQEELSSGKPLSEIYSYMGKPCEDGAFMDDTLYTLQKAVRDGDRNNQTLTGHSSEYGYMLNGYRVIFDSKDRPAGLLCVEIDINRINIEVKQYVRMVCLIGSVLTAIIILIYLFNTKRFFVTPIVKIAESSDAFVKKMRSNAEPEELIYDNTARPSSAELCLLADNVKSMADGVASYMTNLKTATAERERIGTELELARRIQADMLPSIFPAFPERSEFDIYASMMPAKEVGGDFYDFFLTDDDHLVLAIADVSGKGIPAALFMMMSKILIHNYAMQGYSPAKVLELTNGCICQNNASEMFVTIWLGSLNLRTGRIIAANAGHESPVIRQPDGKFELLREKHGIVVGAMDGIRYKENEIALQKGASLFLYTDGVPEASNAERDLFGTERLLEALNGNCNAAPEELLVNVKRAVDAFVGEAEQFDDLTMLGLKLL